jgi:hypothetical protein
MNPKLSPDSEDWRRICEARSWLRQGYVTPQRVDELMASIARHRGVAAAQALREEMRRQWRCRHAWLSA